MALVPIVIVYWNFVLDPATVDYVFGVLSIVFNVLLLWPWRANFYPPFEWRGQAAYTVRA